jgi:peptidyl-prolyl cis-trans isomerase A (cyclophilin A)
MKALFAVLAVTLLAAQTPPAAVHVLVRTDLGEFEIEIDVARAPVTATNFLKYVDGRHYDGGRFHRTVTQANQPDDEVKIDVIQASINVERTDRFAAIPLERTSQTGIRHLDGTISMARSTSPDSGRSDFFICIGNQPSLDFGGARNKDGQGFAAFGRVTRGMDVVRRIHASANREAQRLTPPIAILSLARVSPAR